MKKLITVCAVFCLTSTLHSATYELCGHLANSFRIEVMYDSVPAILHLQTYDLKGTGGETVLYLDAEIDETNQQATFSNFALGQGSTYVDGTVKAPGLGGQLIPISLSTEIIYLNFPQETVGPANIDPYSLQILMPPIEWNGSAHVNGIIKLGDHELPINLNIPLAGAFDFSGQFNGEQYPDELRLTPYGSNLAETYSGYRAEIGKLNLNGHDIEFYTSGISVNSFDFPIYGFEIPEPCTLLLLGLGGLVSRRALVGAPVATRSHRGEKPAAARCARRSR